MAHTMGEFGWWRFKTPLGGPTSYGYGSAENAQSYIRGRNYGKTGNHITATFIGATDHDARHEGMMRIADLTSVGFDLDEELEESASNNPKDDYRDCEDERSLLGVEPSHQPI